jgi:membrane protease YdiL (CAAX protease family)
MRSRLVPEEWQLTLVTIFAVVILLLPPVALLVDPGSTEAAPPGLFPGMGGSLQDLMNPAAVLLLLVLAVGMTGYGIAVIFAPAYLLSRRAPARPLLDRPPWGVLDLIAVFLLSLSIGFASYAFVGQKEVDVAVLLGDSIFKGLAILVLLVWLHHFRNAGPGDLGLHTSGLLSSVPWGAYLYVSAFPLYYAAGMYSLAAHLAAKAIPEGHPVDSLLLGDEATPGTRLAIAVVAVAMAPLFEEILFRGFLYTTLRKYLGPALAMLGSAAIFAALHPLFGFYQILVLGLVFAYVYERTGNLFVPMVLHMIHNGLVIGLLLLLRGLMGDGPAPYPPFPW